MTAWTAMPGIEDAAAMARIIYLDQNAWVILARGLSDEQRHPREHAALAAILEAVRAGSIAVPLSFSNIYETSKINVPTRRANMAVTQSLVSGGRVFRGRRRILEETLTAHISARASVTRAEPPARWFLSDLWFEAVADHSPQGSGVTIPEHVLGSMRRDPARALLDHLVSTDEQVRLEAVRRHSEGSRSLLARIEARRALVAGETLAVRRRAYAAQLVIDEIDVILAIGRHLGLGWMTVADVGSSLIRGIVADVPILDVERELVARIEDQSRAIDENDLRDMMAFITVLPLADVVVAEKQFVNLARQAGFDERYETMLLTSIFDLPSMLRHPPHGG